MNGDDHDTVWNELPFDNKLMITIELVTKWWLLLITIEWDHPHKGRSTYEQYSMITRQC